ncbi:MAG: ribosomal small subunit methyltransferase [Gammaproteobacteria bacterium]|jgi:16S rRNA (adenine1518-N6/adenine1519-N6)-dimethyltransferase|nr:ribosomal small subunit methyltransferase [Gammaproteobacteria bacterium]
MKHQARKRFGQNFLIDQSIIEGIIQCIRPESGENIVEIGPGCAALTKPLIEASGHISAIELDRDLIPKLKNEFGDKINLIEADALKFDFSSLKKMRLVGNLPYNISTPLLFHLMDYLAFIQDMHFMLQKEVVERIVASPGNKDYGRLSVMIQYFCQVEAVLEVPPEAFDPAPKVDSMVIRLIPYQSPPHPVKDIKLLEKVLQQAFNQRRKTLSNALKELISSEQIKRLGIDPSLRPEHLSIADFVALANSLT